MSSKTFPAGDSLRSPARSVELPEALNETARCTIKLYRGGVCNRSLTDPCKFCRAFDADKDAWAKVFSNAPRVKVEESI